MIKKRFKEDTSKGGRRKQETIDLSAKKKDEHDNSNGLDLYYTIENDYQHPLNAFFSVPSTSSPSILSSSNKTTENENKSSNSDSNKKMHIDNSIDEETGFIDPLFNVGSIFQSASSTSTVNLFANNTMSGINSTSNTGSSRREEVTDPRDTTSDPLWGGVWRATKERILKDYSVKSIKVLSNFTSTASIAQSDDQQQQQQQSLSLNHSRSVSLSKAKIRLEHLEAHQSKITPESRISMSQKEYIDHINKLHGDMKNAWSRNERVLSLKIAIQCAKLLSDVSAPRFYPAMWILVTEVLDSFGEMVYERIISMIGNDRDKQAVPEDAIETARNWLLKLPSISDIVPRIYLEIVLLRCYQFIPTVNGFAAKGSLQLTSTNYNPILDRLSLSIRGISDPLVSVYVRAYLARVTTLMMTLNRKGEMISPSHLFSTFSDYTFIMNEYEQSKRRSDYCDLHILSRTEYDKLHHPATDVLLLSMGRGSSRDQFTLVMLQYQEQPIKSPLLLASIISSFSPEFYITNLQGLKTLIDQVDDDLMKIYLLNRLSRCLLDYEGVIPEKPLADLVRDILIYLKKLRETRKDELHNIEPFIIFIGCSISYTEICVKRKYLLQYVQEYLVFIVEHLHQHQYKKQGYSEFDQETCDNIYHLCSTICLSDPIVSNTKKEPHTIKDQRFSDALASDPFMKLLDMLKPDQKSSFCRKILKSFGEHHEATSDPLIIHSILSISRYLHDSVNALTANDYRNEISDLICSVIKKIDHGNDVEQQLHEYVECRASFSTLDNIISFLVKQVISLIFKSRDLITKSKSGSSKKMAQRLAKLKMFVQTCLAFCFITIPSISSDFTKMNMNFTCGQLALSHNSLPQADAFFKASIAGIVDSGKSLSKPVIKQGNESSLSIPEQTPYDPLELPKIAPQFGIHKANQPDMIAFSASPPLSQDAKDSGKGEEDLIEYLRSLAGWLVYVPGHPEYGPFYLIHGFVNAIEKVEWDNIKHNKTRSKIKAVIPLLYSLEQTHFPYKIEGIESNDSLYGCSDTYLEELHLILDRVMENIVSEVKTSNDQLLQKEFVDACNQYLVDPIQYTNQV